MRMSPLATHCGRFPHDTGWTAVDPDCVNTQKFSEYGASGTNFYAPPSPYWPKTPKTNSNSSTAARPFEFSHGLDPFRTFGRLHKSTCWSGRTFPEWPSMRRYRGSHARDKSLLSGSSLQPTFNRRKTPQQHFAAHSRCRTPALLRH